MRVLILLFVFFNCISVWSQSLIKGRVMHQTEPLSYANVFIKHTQHGTTTNDNGYFELVCDTGLITLVVQMVGYKKYELELSLTQSGHKHLDIQLEEQSYQISEVQIRALNEDPAYPIIRQAISHREIYLQEAKAYKCRVYMKGMQRLTTVPKRVMLIKVPDDIKPGIIYLSESLSDLSFMRPNLVKEKLISSKVSGDNRSFSFNRAGALRLSLYENILPSYGLNQRGFISPIARNALMYYNYQLMGESRENQYTVFKIKLIPKRNSDPVFRGYIYIIKDLWRIHSTDLYIDKSANIEFVDTLHVKQVYAQQNNGLWMPISQRLIFDFEIFGFKGNGYYVALYSNYLVQSAYGSQFYREREQTIHADPPIETSKKIKRQNPKIFTQKTIASNQKEKAIDSIQLKFDPKEFNREILSIDKQANKTPDSIWESVRPVPLTDEEKSDYKTNDSLEVIFDSKAYKDSIDRIRNRFDIMDLLVTGYTYQHSHKRLYYSMRPLPAHVQFNTVEGWVLNPEMHITHTDDNNKKLSIDPNLRYGFSSNRFYARMSTSYLYNPIQETYWKLSIGHFVSQFNKQEPITPFINTFYTLLLHENYLKLFEKTYLDAHWQSEITNGIRFQFNLSYEMRNALNNTTDFSFNESGKTFSSNIPAHNHTQTSFASHHAFLYGFETTFKFAQRYISRPDRRIRYASRFPSLSIQWQGAKPISKNDANFDRLVIGSTWRKNLRIYGAFSISGNAGLFLHKAKVHFMDYMHFDGNQTIFASQSYNGFQLLPYYQYSTTSRFLVSHINHHFNGFWFNKIPLLRKLKWQEVISFNYLKTDESPQYMELGVGIEHIFKFLRVDYFQSYKNGLVQMQGIRFGLGF